MDRRTVQMLVGTKSMVVALLSTFRYGQGWAPLVPQNVQTDAAVRVDVWVVDAGGEVDLRGLEGVVCWEVD